MDSQSLLPAAQAVGINSGDTAWVLISTGLVLLMTPGLAFYYGGLAGEKNVLSTIMHSFICMALIIVQWVLWGYTLAFGPDKAHLIGGLDWLGLRGVTGAPNPDYAATIPHIAFMIYMAMFAVIAPAIITRAFGARIKFGAFILFVLLWATLVYDPLAHWTWGLGGWMRNLGVLDFAGGTVVHINSGIAAVAAAVVFRSRLAGGRDHQGPAEPHNIPFVLLGAALLWFGWFGWTAGGALAANSLAASAVVVTNVAAAAAVLGWTAMAWWRDGRPSVVGAASGAVAGLVAITPASGFVSPMSAIFIGLGAGIFGYFALRLVSRWKGVGDTLDAFAVHGVGGIWGALATGLFASLAVNAIGADGLFYGNAALLGKQAVAVVASAAYSFVMTWVILMVIDRIVGLRVKEGTESLDEVVHGERAYTTR